jgi:hypothetical protein
MAHEVSAVLEDGVPEPGEAAQVMQHKLRFHTTHGIYQLISNLDVPRLSS